MNLPRIIIAGTHSGVGKTTLTLGIISALKKRGVNVQAFKAGPDYIDPTYHSEASGKMCGNLDSWLLSKNTIIELFKRRAEDADLSVIEGVMGLYDGLKDTELGSTAHLAKILNCPVILVLDARSLSRSAAATALGYKKFDKNVNIAGIILNNIASINHYNYIKAAIEKKAGISVLGYLPRDANLKLSERHLGLVPLEEKKLQHGFCQKLSKLVEANINLTRLLKIGQQAKSISCAKEVIFKKEPLKSRVRIAIAKDAAFNFYYQDNLDILSHLGADIVAFSPLKDRELPKGVDGLYIGGGFPEIFASGLSKNKSLRWSIYHKAESGLPIYAECGGLMYLVESIMDFKKRIFSMVGVFKCSVSMGDRLHRMGYVNVRVIKDNILGKQGDRSRAHMFHWSRLTDVPKDLPFAYKIIKDKNNVFYDGLIGRNVLASYAHLHFAANREFAKNFIDRCRQFKMNPVRNNGLPNGVSHG
ncbi:MAG: cobyrinate a,c-diamide synthase [Candidatus Omnitrophota bacterium]|nr:cobyrinate a,c-diamide synthase [Candidatus Omnitrophota bacterium]